NDPHAVVGVEISVVRIALDVMQVNAGADLVADADVTIDVDLLDRMRADIGHVRLVDRGADCRTREAADDGADRAAEEESEGRPGRGAGRRSEVGADGLGIGRKSGAKAQQSGAGENDLAHGIYPFREGWLVHLRPANDRPGPRFRADLTRICRGRRLPL